MLDERKDVDSRGIVKGRLSLGHPDRLKVYQHSDLLYWWVVWFWGLMCAGLTWLQGTKIKLENGAPDILVHPRAWVGISFICVIIFVLVFTNVRARGMKSMVLLLLLALLGGILEHFEGVGILSDWLHLMKIHMNLAFYVFFSITLMIFWLVAIFIFDRMSYIYFAPGQVGRKVVMSGGSENFVPLYVQTSRSSDDLFVHRILGLWFLGFFARNLDSFGTGDLDIRFTIPGNIEKHYELKNVWRVGHVEEEINRLMRAQEHVPGKAG